MLTFIPTDPTQDSPTRHSGVSTANLRSAWWTAHQDDDGVVRLQIELGHDYAVLLSCSPEEAPSITLWHGSGERDFNQTAEDPGFSPDRFRHWIEEAAR